jgi:hypothetical protein
MLPNDSPAVAALLTFAVTPGRIPEVLCEVDPNGTVELRLMVLANGYAATLTLSGPKEAVKETMNVAVVELGRTLAGGQDNQGR